MNVSYTHCLETIRTRPLDPNSYNQFGSFLYKQGRIQEAIPYFKKALRLDSTFWPAHYNLANSYAKQNHMELAAAHFQITEKLDPTNATARHMNHALNPDKHHQKIDSAPLSYIEQLFDQYAPYYNQHLKQQLNYTVPTQLRNALVRVARSQLH